ncbi:hypothetical protein J4217_03110 [Candidatus Pacearchaeota archaeon]|nr:hypothetical protein [Candidatus Pacearchaeota archaeon]
MGMQNAMYVILGVIVIIGIGLIFLLSTWAEKQNLPTANSTENKEACINLGCPEGTLYVGSVLKKIYYPCICAIASQINATDLACFETKSRAVLNNFYKGYC